jgi:hypothetical protein
MQRDQKSANSAIPLHHTASRRFPAALKILVSLVQFRPWAPSNQKFR